MWVRTWTQSRASVWRNTLKVSRNAWIRFCFSSCTDQAYCIIDDLLVVASGTQFTRSYNNTTTYHGECKQFKAVQFDKHCPWLPTTALWLPTTTGLWLPICRLWSATNSSTTYPMPNGYFSSEIDRTCNTALVSAFESRKCNVGSFDITVGCVHNVWLTTKIDKLEATTLRLLVITGSSCQTTISHLTLI